MTDFAAGDLVVLKSGSMRMVVEAVDGRNVAVIWAHEGEIGRDSLPAFALAKWEDRGERPASRAGDEGRSGRKPYQGDRKAGAKPPGERPPKTGMDGKPRQKSYFRKEG